MKNQALFSLKDKSKKLKCRLLQFWFGALRVKDVFNCYLNIGTPLLAVTVIILKFEQDFTVQQFVSKVEMANSANPDQTAP